MQGCPLADDSSPAKFKATPSSIGAPKLPKHYSERRKPRPTEIEAGPVHQVSAKREGHLFYDVAYGNREQRDEAK
jgi:hypothetical protein